MKSACPVPRQGVPAVAGVASFTTVNPVASATPATQEGNAAELLLCNDLFYLGGGVIEGRLDILHTCVDIVEFSCDMRVGDFRIIRPIVRNEVGLDRLPRCY